MRRPTQAQFADTRAQTVAAEPKAIGNEDRASILRAPHSKYETVQLDLDDPQPTEVLVEMVATGMCHADDHMATGDIPVPVFPICGGHKGAGVVQESVPPDAVFSRAITSFSRSFRSVVAAGFVLADSRTCATTQT
jgi:NADPH:quinone reductase-like Zn-dependent oxidoreductase